MNKWSVYFLFLPVPKWVFFRDHQCHPKGGLPLSILTIPWTFAAGHSQEIELQKRPFLESRKKILMFLAFSGGLVTAGCSKFAIMADLWKGYKLIRNVELYLINYSLEKYQRVSTTFKILFILSNLLRHFFLIFLSMPYCLLWNLEESIVVHFFAALFSLDHWFIFTISDFH